ncbi:predicted transcriptional regulator [Clostridium sp. CAG:307]|nr:predicted transcriptional regulator [Clostridium sp. CAG:307]
MWYYLIWVDNMKIAQAIKMMNYLASVKKASREELANLLETNVRNITEYRKELINAGYDIGYLRGIGGGYFLDGDNILPNPRLKESEKKALLEASSYLNARYDFLNKNEFNVALGKVLNSSYVNKDIDSPMIIDRFPLVMKDDEIKYRYDMISKALFNKNKIRISYLSTKNRISEHILHPYKIYMYNLAWYVLAFNETINDVGYFKLNRIKEIELLKEKYYISKTFNEADYLDQYGMKNNGEYIPVSIEVSSPYAALVKERIYGKNQQIISVDANTTILKCEMQNLASIVSFILGFGSKAKVLEPQEVKDAVKKELEIMLSINEE